MKNYTILFGLITIVAFIAACSTSRFISTDTDIAPTDQTFKARWACSENLEITINQPNLPKITLTSDHIDFKPSWSTTGDKLTFFRRISKGKTGFTSWRTKICVANTDGTDLRELTTGEYPDLNPTWTRDGSNMIVFNRLSTVPAWKNQIYIISPDDSLGEEQLVSHPSNQYYEWANSTLKDGRIFIDRFNNDYAKSFLLTPNPGNMGKYEEINRPDERLWHKLSISPSETKVAYMLDNDRKLWTYNDAVIAIAEFDKDKLTVNKPIIITEMNLENIYEYPRWTEDEKHLVYDSNKSGNYQIYAYNLKNKTTIRVSPDSNRNYRFAHCENMPK